MKTAYFAGGCFWCITPTFQEMDGVYRVVSGYSGGDEQNPVYEDVKYQRTGHRETIKIEYDPDAVSFAELFEIFLSGVDPFDEGGSISTAVIPIPWQCTTFRRKKRASLWKKSKRWKRSPASGSVSA